MMYFSYKQVCDVLFDNLKKHQDILRDSTASLHEKEYSRYCMYHCKELRKVFDSHAQKNDW